MNFDQVVALIPAAGFSSRMGAFKPLLPLGETTVIERTIQVFRSAGLSDIRVVTGFHSVDLRKPLKSKNVRQIENRNFRDGMMASVKTGVASLEPDRKAFFLLPADIPLVRPETLTTLLDSWADGQQNIVYPCFRGKRGHPPLISTGYSGKILAWQGQGGLRSFLEQFEDRSKEVPVADEGIVMDLDTPQDYHRIRDRHRRLDIPSPNECMALLSDIFSVDRHIVDHCRSVSELAHYMGETLNRSGSNLDVERIRAAGLVHDLARKQPGHADAGARILEKKGFSGISGIVARHMDIGVDENSSLDEAHVVYIADKLSDSRQIVSLEERFNQKEAAFGNDPVALKAIRSRRQTAMKIKERIESQTDKSLVEIVNAHRRHDGDLSSSSR